MAGIVYFIQAEGKELYKIGWTNKPAELRLKSLQVGCPHTLILAGIIETHNPRGLEAAIHQELSEYRERGEWFAIAAQEVERIIKQRGMPKTDDLSQINITDTVIGKWFHSFINGEIEWQGKVLAALENGYYLLQLYSWTMGQPSIQKVAHLQDMTSFAFYQSNDHMQCAYNCQIKNALLKDGGIEWDNDGKVKLNGLEDEAKEYQD